MEGERVGKGQGEANQRIRDQEITKEGRLNIFSINQGELGLE